MVAANFFRAILYRYRETRWTQETHNTRGELMTDTNLNSGKVPPPPSLNDSLPSGNPSLKVMLTVLSCIGLGALVLVFRSSLGF
jgi:hypothetical protein